MCSVSLHPAKHRRQEAENSPLITAQTPPTPPATSERSPAMDFSAGTGAAFEVMMFVFFLSVLLVPSMCGLTGRERGEERRERRWVVFPHPLFFFFFGGASDGRGSRGASARKTGAARDSHMQSPFARWKLSTCSANGNPEGEKQWARARARRKRDGDGDGERSFFITGEGGRLAGHVISLAVGRGRSGISRQLHVGPKDVHIIHIPQEIENMWIRVRHTCSLGNAVASIVENRDRAGTCSRNRS